MVSRTCVKPRLVSLSLNRRAKEADDAYAAYTQRKRDLIEYIAGLEKAQRIPQESRVLSVFTTLPKRNADESTGRWLATP
jgi:hypothetical protein